MYVCINVCMYVCVQVYMYVILYVCKFVCISIFLSDFIITILSLNFNNFTIECQHREFWTPFRKS